MLLWVNILMTRDNYINGKSKCDGQSALFKKKAPIGVSELNDRLSN